ncbi:MAG: hypothetical protein AAFY56_04905 [Pseudomonadota bacterium]
MTDHGTEGSDVYYEATYELNSDEVLITIYYGHGGNDTIYASGNLLGLLDDDFGYEEFHGGSGFDTMSYDRSALAITYLGNGEPPLRAFRSAHGL